MSYQALSGSKAPAAVQRFDAVFSNLDYSGGPVMPSSTNYTIVWNPSNYTGTAFQTGYVSGVNQFLHDVAADSGKATNSYSVATQYNDAAGDTAAYNSTYGGTFTDTDPLPASGCTSGTQPCLTDAQLQTELDTFLASQHLPRDLTHEYFLLTPPDVVSCFDSTSTQCSGQATAPATPVFCAYHSASTTSSSFLYANMPDVAGVIGCDPFVTFCPNSTCAYDNGPADGVLSALSHETIESNTDPEPNNAWTDWQSCAPTAPVTCGGEIGDKCAGDEFSDPEVQLQDNGLGVDTPYNDVINGHHYLLQMQWSNQTHQCVHSFTSNGNSASASFTQSPGTATTVNFDAGTSTASGGVAQYVWQFNDGPQQQTTTIETTSPTISHTFGAPGTYDVALTVMGGDGTSNGTAHNVAVGSTDESPTVSFSPPVGGVQSSPVSFTGSGSDPDGTITSYAWTFGDGISSTSQNPTHVYAAAGTYTVTLTVTDSDNQTAEISHPVTIEELPTASFIPPTGIEGSPVSFDGAPSNDPDGTISSYVWTFGDGGSATGPSPSHTYATHGTYTVTLTVTDSDGRSGQVSHLVTISDESPTASFTAPTGGISGTPVTFTGSGSDPDGTITSYAWTFGDGSSSTSQNPTQAYAAAGTYSVTLTVTDSSGQAASVTQLVSIASPPPPPPSPPPPPPPAPPPPPPTQCTVPNVIGKSLGAARGALKAAHCAVGKVGGPGKKPKRNPGKHKKWTAVVSRENPGRGSKHPTDTKVELTLVWRALKT